MEDVFYFLHLSTNPLNVLLILKITFVFLPTCLSSSSLRNIEQVVITSFLPHIDLLEDIKLPLFKFKYIAFQQVEHKQKTYPQKAVIGYWLLLFYILLSKAIKTNFLIIVNCFCQFYKVDTPFVKLEILKRHFPNISIVQLVCVCFIANR